IFENLTTSYKYDPSQPSKEGQVARANMHHAATLAGMSFANAFLGINHSLAHKIGGEFELPHGLAIAISMPHVIKFNAVTGNVKRTPFPRYEVYRAEEDYAEIARYIGLKGKTDAELVEKLIQAIKKLTDSVEIDITLSGNGVKKAHLQKEADRLADLTYDDQCTPANPRQPKISELKQILLDCF
ncbi:MAG: iron-containing alcohol dehydrogenase, partial [Streptococcaceae bacterium]|nr:iron-containing alcohol dehydrogenase [Streptococcaceae bacterium]